MENTGPKMPQYQMEKYFHNMMAYIRMEYMAEYNEITEPMKKCFVHLWSENTPIPNAAGYFHNSFRKDYQL